MEDHIDIQQEYAKCYLDKSRKYVIEKYLSTNNGGKVQPFILFPRQIEFLHSLGKNKATIAIKPRQAGITTVTAGYVAGQCAFCDEGEPETVLCIANQITMASDMLLKIEAFIDQMPRWVWGDEYYSPDPNNEKNFKSIYTICNTKELKLFNGCRVVARAAGPNSSRGVSAVSILILDEAAFIEKNPKGVYASAVATTSSVKNAKIIMVSTPNGKDELYYDTYMQALQKKNGYNVVEFRWYQDPRYNKHLQWSRVDKENNTEEIYVEPILDKTGTIKYDEQHWAEMVANGWKASSPWYISMCQQFNNDPVQIAQELDVSFQGSVYTILSPEVIEMQRTENVMDPLKDFCDPICSQSWFWKQPIEGHVYICAIDNGRGDASDTSTIEMIDMSAVDEEGKPIMEQVMEYQGKMPGDELGIMAYNYAIMYNNAFVVVESIGGQGDATILAMQRLGYTNFYYDDDNLREYAAKSDPRRFKPIDKEGHMPGFHSSNVRYPMLSNFATLVRTNQYKVRSIRVIDELEHWVMKNGRQDHMANHHDDTITATAMGLFVAMFSLGKQQKQMSLNRALLQAYKRSRVEVFGQESFDIEKKKAVKTKTAADAEQQERINKKLKRSFYIKKKDPISQKRNNNEKIRNAIGYDYRTGQWNV